MNAKNLSTIILLLTALGLTCFTGCKKESEPTTETDPLAAKPSPQTPQDLTEHPTDAEHPAAQQPQPTLPQTADAAWAKLDFTLNDHQGNTVSLADHKGQIIVLEWINPDCPFVKRHYQKGTMASLARHYRDDGVVWLAINSTSTFNQEKNKAFHEKHDLPYPILDDHNGTTGRTFNAKTTPHLFVIDTQGTVVYQGAIDNDPQGAKAPEETVNYISKALDELLEGRAISANRTNAYGCSVKYAES